MWHTCFYWLPNVFGEYTSSQQCVFFSLATQFIACARFTTRFIRLKDESYEHAHFWLSEPYNSQLWMQWPIAAGLSHQEYVWCYDLWFMFLQFVRSHTTTHTKEEKHWTSVAIEKFNFKQYINLVFIPTVVAINILAPYTIQKKCGKTNTYLSIGGQYSKFHDKSLTFLRVFFFSLSFRSSNA